MEPERQITLQISVDTYNRLLALAARGRKPVAAEVRASALLSRTITSEYKLHFSTEATQKKIAKKIAKAEKTLQDLKVKAGAEA